MSVIPVLSVLLAFIAYQAHATSSFYTDNYRGQSIPMGKMERQQKKNVQQVGGGAGNRNSRFHDTDRT